MALWLGMRLVQWFIVWALVNLCGLLDKIPVPRHDEDGMFYWGTAGWGCRFRLALLSDKLDQRWKTGVWEDAP